MANRERVLGDVYVCVCVCVFETPPPPPPPPTTPPAGLGGEGVFPWG